MNENALLTLAQQRLSQFPQAGATGEGQAFKPYDPHFLQGQLDKVRAKKPDQVHVYIDTLANTYSPSECLSILAQTRYPVQSLLRKIIDNSGRLRSPAEYAVFTLRLAAAHLLSAEWDPECAWWTQAEDQAGSEA
ncbi:MAG: hypothetical protein JW850_03595 [Thermoflexales bacterium]|nr:hypothetical protein [Thermoflexales bacterium]